MRTLRRCTALVLFVCSVGVVTPARAQVTTPARAEVATPLQAALDRLVAEGMPGATALQRLDGQTTYATSGVGNLETQEPIRATDRYRVGSITKSIVATVVLQLVGEGHLSLDDTVEHWLPGLVPSADQITVRQLLNHTSGLADHIDFDFYLGILENPLETWRPRELVEMVASQPLLFEPGSSWSYSNTGYVVLGLIISQVNELAPRLERYGPVFEVYRRIVAPLGLTKTSFPVTNPDIAGPHAHGYVIDPPLEWGIPPVLDTTRTNPSYGWTAGAVVSTLDDIARFHRALFAGDLLEDAEQEALQTTVPVVPGVLEFGLGVYKVETPCGTAWGHDGGTPSHVNISLVSADGSHQAVVMGNRDANTWTPEIGEAFVAAYLTAFCGESVPTASVQQSAAELPHLLPIATGEDVFIGATGVG